jgi:hypothetical protein
MEKSNLRIEQQFAPVVTASRLHAARKENNIEHRMPVSTAHSPLTSLSLSSRQALAKRQRVLQNLQAQQFRNQRIILRAFKMREEELQQASIMRLMSHPCTASCVGSLLAASTSNCFASWSRDQVLRNSANLRC